MKLAIATTAISILVVGSLSTSPGLGGGDVISNGGSKRFGKRPSADATIEKMLFTDARFAEGFELFDKPFHRSQGLGVPEMNADSCRACHQDPIIGGAGGLELNVSRYGHESGGVFSDVAGGQGLSKLRPPYVEGREEHDPSTANVFEQRQTPSVLGDGLIDGISDATILANEDPTDANLDGIYGVARVLTVDGQPEVGRFGWKGQIPRLADFVRDAMGGELGITTPDDGRGFAFLSDADNVADPELQEREVTLLAYFLSNLPAPERKGGTDPGIAAGEAIFSSVGCATCHIPSLPGADGPVNLYSNLLLHNVMPSGYRGMAEPGAGMGFFQTPPLWGISDTAPYMHDGRASNLEAAILAHDGEAAGVIADYQLLTPQEQSDLLLFLEDL